MRAQQPWEWGWTSLLDGSFDAWDVQPGASPASGPEGTFPSSWLSFRNDSAKGKSQKERERERSGNGCHGKHPPARAAGRSDPGEVVETSRPASPAARRANAARSAHSARPDSPEAAQPWDFPAPVRAVPLCPGCCTSPGSGAALGHRGHRRGDLHVAATGPRAVRA